MRNFRLLLVELAIALLVFLASWGLISMAREWFT